MPDYPLMFTVRDAISGNGYLAGVTVYGRAIMREEEDGKWWMTGVRPSGITAPGDSPGDAGAPDRVEPSGGHEERPGVHGHQRGENRDGRQPGILNSGQSRLRLPETPEGRRGHG